jgi:phosphoribosylglycinamide formyltransferase 1
MKRLAIFVSGTGTLFETLTTRCRAVIIPADVVLMVASSEKAGAIARAERLKVPYAVLRREDCASDEEFAKRLLHELKTYAVDVICLVGYLKLLPPSVIREYKQRALNIHPALLPGFGGKGMFGHRVHEAVIASGTRISGATVHLVDEEYDHGPIVLQRGVFVKPDDSADSLAERVHAIEHDLYTDALRLLCENRLHVEGRRVFIIPAPKT